MPKSFSLLKETIVYVYGQNVRLAAALTTNRTVNLVLLHIHYIHYTCLGLNLAVSVPILPKLYSTVVSLHLFLLHRNLFARFPPPVVGNFDLSE